VDLLRNNIIKWIKKAGIFRPFLCWIFLAGSLFCSSCSSGPKTPIGNSQRFDYYPNKIDIKYAKGFKVDYFKSYKVVSVFDNTDSGSLLQKLILVEQGTRIPSHQPSDVIVRVPLTSVSCLSTSHVPYLKRLNQIETIAGIGNPDRVLDSVLNKQIKDGWTLGITRSGQLDVEKVLESNTQLLMAYPFDKPVTDGLDKFDIPVVFVGEYLENSVLARAEWLKFFALFFNDEKEARFIFKGIEDKYQQVKKKTAGIKDSDKAPVFFGSFYQDTWFAPGGKSLMANLFMDAGANYIFSKNATTKNIIVDNELIVSKIPGIEFWGQVFANDKNPGVSLFMGTDSRLINLAATYNLNFFYVNSSRVDYFGKANLEPDILLKDLANIFHPGLFPKHQFMYFKPLKHIN